MAIKTVAITNNNNQDELCHYGVKGQQWGVRRYETEGGHLTEEGKERYYDRYEKKKDRKMFGRLAVHRIEKQLKKGDDLDKARGQEVNRLNKSRDRARAAGIIGAVIAGLGGMAVGSLIPEKLQNGSLVLASIMDSPDLVKNQYIFYRDNFKTVTIAGGGAIGALAGYKVARKVAMNAQGYRSRRYKD